MTMAAKNDKPETDAPETVRVVMTTATYDAALGDKVEVSPEQAAALVAEGHARFK